NLYTAGVIPAGTYPHQDKDNAIGVVQNILIANAKMPDQVAYDIVKTFIEKRDELVAVHGEAKSITLENQVPKNTPIPWHPGAVKYFREKALTFCRGEGVGGGCRARAASIPPPEGGRSPASRRDAVGGGSMVAMHDCLDRAKTPTPTLPLSGGGSQPS